ncbi:MAG: SURF1 family cytochrome oxidase biogenesis protein [Marmoricola sp.]
MLVLLLRPRYWGGHLAMVLCVAAATGLGVWQLDAWHTRRADAARDISNEKPVALLSVMGGDSSFPGRSLGRPVTLTGSWMTGTTIYVSDRYLHGRRGYWVVTPVLVDGTSSAIPVVRGWASAASSTDPTGTVDVTGWLQATEGSGPLDPDPTDDVVPTMRLASLVSHVKADLFSAYVVARDVRAVPPGTDAMTGIDHVSAAAIPKVSGFTALRNFLYALEWWVFALFALFVWVRWCQDSYELATNPPEPDEAEAGEDPEPAPDAGSGPDAGSPPDRETAR